MSAIAIADETFPDDAIKMSCTLGTVLLITIQCIYTLILTPISIYYAHKLYKLSQENIPFFSKRHPKVVVFTIFIFNIYLIIIRPIADFIWLCHICNFIDTSESIEFLSRLLSNVIQLLMYAAVTRLWLLYFDYTHKLQILSKIWKQQIAKQKHYKPWTLKYKWLGSSKVLFAIWIGLCFVILLYLGIGMAMSGGYESLNYFQLIGFLPSILMIILAVKIRKCRDQFAIQKEMVLFALTMLFGMSMYVLLILFCGIHSLIRLIITNLALCGGCYAYCYISTYWVIHQYNKQKIYYEELTKNTVENREYKNMTLEEILSTKDGFDLLADHLVKEFSIESLLFLFEMMQIKQELVDTNLLDDEEVGVMININSKRIHKLRRNSCHVSSTVELKKNLQHIVDQYIYNDSKYSVNISSRTRQKILSTFAKVQDEVYNVPKYDWIDTRNVYQSTTQYNHSQYLSRTITDSNGNTDDEETSKLETTSPAPIKGKIIMHRMHAISDIQIASLKEAPTFDWIDSKGNNTVEVEKKEKENKLMIEHLKTFDKAILEIINLLSGDSLLRFYSTNDYQRILKQYTSLKNLEIKQCDSS